MKTMSQVAHIADCPETLDDARALLKALAIEVDALRADKERLDWLDAEATRIYPVAALTVKVGYDRHSPVWVNCTGTARESIDRARAAAPHTQEIP